jgi:subtilisin
MTPRVSVLISALLISIASVSSQPIEGRYIIRLKAGADAQAVARAHGVQPDYVYSRVLNGMAGFVPPGILKKLAADPSVESISADHAVYAIGKPGTGGGGTTPTGEVAPAGAVRIGAFLSGYSGAGVGVAVVDTGLDFNHSDLKGNIAAASFNAFNQSAPGQDDQGHGTHVGGTIAATDNTIDVIGVAPLAKLYAVKVLDASGSGSDSAVIAGLDWVAANANSLVPKIRVVNMSLGRSAFGAEVDNPMHEAISRLTQANIAVVVAAGNDATLEARDQVPAGFPEVIAVGSTTAKDGTKAKRINTIIRGDTASYFTSDGALAVDENGMAGVTVSAPGEEQENIDAAGFIQSVGILSLKLGGGTTRMSGTSMASPHVAGVVAQLWQKYAANGLTPEQIRSVLRASALNAGTAPLPSPTRSYTDDGEREGIVDAVGALN